MAKSRSNPRKTRKRTANPRVTRRGNNAPGTKAAARSRTGRFFLNPVVWLFLICFGAYTINGDFLPGKDQESNMIISVNMLKNGSLSVTPKQAPGEFFWYSLQPGEEGKWGRIARWDEETDALYESGGIKPRPFFHLVESVHPGHYVSAFGIGTALTALPVYGLLNLFTDIAENHHWWWFGAKTLAALLVAFSGVLIFLSLRRFVGLQAAFFGALVFGLGSGAWSISSQALWQQTPHIFFLSLGAWFLLGSRERKNFPLYCGAALGMAVLCRPTGVFAALCVGLYFLVVARRDLLKYVLGALPFAAAVWLYNDYYLGSPFTFAQSIAAESLAAQQVSDAGGGVGGIWQTPVLDGLGGLLFSPSRGLLFYSPLLLSGFAGAVMLWKNPRKFAPLIPLQVAALAMLLTAAKWFDWWGGATYGPRPLVDIGVFLALLAIPVLDRPVFNAPLPDKASVTRWMRGVLVALFLYSCAVQAVGAWAYNGIQWNRKDGMDPGKPEYRGRFWSLSDSQILYYATHFKPARKYKQRMLDTVLNKNAPVVSRP